MMFKLTELDHRIIKCTERGLPLALRPFAAIASEVGASEEEVISRFRQMKEAGVIRRIAAVPNHYKLGFVSNGMTVWDVDDDKISELGKRVGSLDCVSHCYKRPRHLPDWPYNLFAMVHGRNKSEVQTHAEKILSLLKPSLRSYDILFSSEILKKTGFRSRKEI
jgi:DNA-binding Lrp family transcriptional regulator